MHTNTLIEHKRLQYSKQRSRLKKKKTASARRHLKKCASKEANFRKDVNHCISKAIVTKAERTSQGIALEELVQFFDKSRVRKGQRALQAPSLKNVVHVADCRQRREKICFNRGLLLVCETRLIVGLIALAVVAQKAFRLGGHSVSAGAVKGLG